MAGRLTDRAGSSAYVLGGVVVYSNEAKVAFADVPAELIASVGAVSPEVAAALADGARARFGADVGIGITGIAGPGGGTPEKPVGMVCVCVSERRRSDRAHSAAAGRPRHHPRSHDHGGDAPAPATAARGRGSRGGVTGAPPESSPAAPGPDHLRLFVALELPQPARDALVAFRDAAADPDVWRPVAPDALHLTLAFLGRRPATDLVAIDEVLYASVGAAPRLALGEALLLPPRRARVLCASLEDLDGTLGDLQSRVSAGLAAAGVYTPETRPFRAHATVARLRPRARAPRAVEAAPEPLEFLGEALTLFVSRLHPSGARYEPIVRLELR